MANIEKIEQLIIEQKEYEKNSNTPYKSNHEAYARLKERIEDSGATQKLMEKNLSHSWLTVREDDEERFRIEIINLLATATQLAQLAISVGAACERSLESIENRKILRFKKAEEK